MSERSRVVVWLNGSFGSGKSTLAKAVVAVDPRWRIFDPEYVGFMLAPQFPERDLTDFQDLQSWRRLVPIVAHELAQEIGQPLLIVQTVLDQGYWHEIADSIRGHGYSLHHVLLDVHPDALGKRITADRDVPAAADWRRQHIPAFLDARREWLADAADLVIDTTSMSPQQAAHQLGKVIAAWNTRTLRSAQILTDASRRVVLRGHRALDIPAIVEQCHDTAMIEYTRIPRPYTVEHAHELLDLARTGWAQPSTVSPRFWAITTLDQNGDYAFAGTIDYRPTGHRTAVVGYGLHPAYRGTGLMSVALGLVLDYAFNHDDQDLMSWHAAVGNWASAKTAWRNGFRFEGHVRGLCLRPDGSFSDGWIATLHKDDPRTPTQPWHAATDSLGTASRPSPSSIAVPPARSRQHLGLAWFGTSLMEHLEAYNPRLSDQTDLPELGDNIEVTERRHRGYVHALLTTWRARYPWIDFSSDNCAKGGATSRDILGAVRAATVDPQRRWDLVVIGAGINDVWRIHQQRHAEAVEIEEFDANLRVALQILTDRACQVLVVEEPPIGWEPAIDVTAANSDIAAYNQRARRAAADHGVSYVQVWDEILFADACLGRSPVVPAGPTAASASVWSDGVHLSEHGDELLRALLDRHISEHRIIDDLLM